MNFYSICIARVGDCLRTVKNISEVDNCPITDKKVVKKIFNKLIKDLEHGDYIAIYENGFCVTELYL